MRWGGDGGAAGRRAPGQGAGCRRRDRAGPSVGAASWSSWRRVRCLRAAAPRPVPRALPGAIAREAENAIGDPSQAINVFDFEPAMRKNVAPAHFGYVATGLDDEVTLRANRDGFLKFQLRPRRLIDVSTIDMSCDILGAHLRQPDRAGADRQQSGVASRRRGGRGQGGKTRQPSANPLDGGLHLGGGGNGRARGADLVPALSDARIGRSATASPSGPRRPGAPSSC